MAALLHVEVVVGVLHGCVRVAHAAVLVQVLVVLRLVRELLRAEEQHVLAEVRQASHLLRVGEVPDADVERRGALLGDRVAGQQHRELVRQRDRAVLARVGRRLHHGGHAVRSQAQLRELRRALAQEAANPGLLG